MLTFEQKNYKAAYEIAPRILQNYPLSPKRLGNLFIAAVFTRHFQDIPKYHSLYEQLDHKSGEIKKVFSAAIFTAGKFHLKDNNIQSAAECFDIGVNVMGADVEYLTKIIRELLKMQAAGAQWAAVYLTRFPRDEVGGATHSRLSFLVDRYLRNKVQVIEAGKKMIAQGFGDEETFPVMVTLLAETGKLILAEDMATKAIAQFPALRKSLYELIETSKSKLHQH